MGNTLLQFLRKNRFYLFTVLFICLLFLGFFLFPTEEYRLSNFKVTKLYYADNISDAHHDLIQRFNDVHQGHIEVIPIDLPFSKFSTNERKELLARSLRSKSNLIDIFSVDYIWVQRFAKWCMPLDEYFAEEERRQLAPHVMESCYYKGRMVALPHYTDIAHMYYRSDLIAQLPDGAAIEAALRESMSWKDFIALGRRMKRLGYNQPFYIYPIDNFEGLTCCFYEGVGAESDQIFFPDRIQINHSATKRSIDHLAALVHQYHLTPKAAYTFDEYQGYVYALETDALFFRGWPGLLQHHRNAIPNGHKLDYIKMAPLPHFEDIGPRFVYGGWNFMISKHSTKSEAARHFIRFALEEENQKRLFQIGGYLPSVQTVYRDSAFVASHPMLGIYEALLKQGVHRPYREDYTRISDILSYSIHMAITGEMETTQAIELAERAMHSRRIILK